MRFYVNGFSWEPKFPAPGQPAVTRAEAQAALERVHYPGAATRHYREAQAAFSVRDYQRTVFCCEAAEEAGSQERWT